ncbi:hypothetical protein Tco_1273717 [Tanacetum coccineum]
MTAVINGLSSFPGGEEDMVEQLEREKWERKIQTILAREIAQLGAQYLKQNEMIILRWRYDCGKSLRELLMMKSLLSERGKMDWIERSKQMNESYLEREISE